MIVKNAIIFDHDGTLVDSMRAVEVCTNHVIEKAGYRKVDRDEIKKGMAFPTTERFTFHTGVRDSVIIKKMAEDFYREMHNTGLGLLRLYDGVKDALDDLARNGFSLGMVTNNQGLFVRKAAAGLSYAFDFEVILGEENVPRPKPDPSGLLQACAGMGVGPEQCWYIGDGEPDYKAARAAGMKCGLVSWGAHGREELLACRPDRLFDSPGEMKDYFLERQING